METGRVGAAHKITANQWKIYTRKQLWFESWELLECHIPYGVCCSHRNYILNFVCNDFCVLIYFFSVVSHRWLVGSYNFTFLSFARNDLPATNQVRPLPSTRIINHEMPIWIQCYHFGTFHRDIPRFVCRLRIATETRAECVAAHYRSPEIQHSSDFHAFVATKCYHFHHARMLFCKLRHE